MRQGKFRLGALAALAGMLFGFGGCLDSWWGRMLWDAALDQTWDYVLDNDALFDLFEDGDTVAAE